MSILTTLSKKYSEHHDVTYTPESLEASTKLAMRYLPDRFLPDKAIDLMDEAGAIVQIESFEGDGTGQVTEAEVAAVVSMWTGIPLSKLTSDEAASMLDFEDTLHERVCLRQPPSTPPPPPPTLLPPPPLSPPTPTPLPPPPSPPRVIHTAPRAPLHATHMASVSHLVVQVIGQSFAVSAIARALRRARVGLRSPRRPVASMIFCGPTGVGKTELAKAVAEAYYGEEKAMVTPRHPALLPCQPSPRASPPSVPALPTCQPSPRATPS